MFRETDEALAPNMYFTRLATDTQIENTQKALEAHGIHTFVAEHGEEAEKMVFDMLPKGAEVFTTSSQTLEQLGIPAELERSQDYNVVRTQLKLVKNKRDQVKLGATPQYVIGSVQAVTEDGRVMIASNTGSQIGPYSAGAEKVIWVVGTQKIVNDITEGLRRIDEYALPREEERMMREFGVHSAANKVMIVNQEKQPGRITMILVKEELGF